MSGVSGSHKNLQQFWHRHKLTPKKQIICDYPQAIIGLAADGIGLAMVPKHSAEAAQRQGSPIALIGEFEQQLPFTSSISTNTAKTPPCNSYATRCWKCGKPQRPSENLCFGFQTACRFSNAQTTAANPKPHACRATPCHRGRILLCRICRRMCRPKATHAFFAVKQEAV